ncbi:MAG: hypothetical protein RIS45_302 [Planctomycetota bacterium]
MAGTFKTTTAKRVCPVCEGTSYCFASEDAVFCRAQVNPAPAGWCVMVRRVAPSGKRYVERVRSVSIGDEVIRSKLARRGDNLGPHWLYVREDAGGGGGGGSGGVQRMSREERAKIRARLEREDADAVAFARKVWEWAKGGSDHPAVKAYLCGNRGVPVTAHVEARGFGDWIRFAPTLKWRGEDGQERRAPGLVCGMVAGRSPLAPEDLRGKLTAVQRIYLERDAAAGYRKLSAIGEAKKIVGRPYDGGCWISTPERDAGNVMCIGEGVETMAAVFAATGYACVAAMSTTGVRAFSVSDALARMCDAIVYCADHDTLTFDRMSGRVDVRPGITHANLAAGAMRERLARIGWRGVVVVAAPETVKVAGGLLSAEVDEDGRGRPYGEREWLEKCRAWFEGAKDGERPERPKGIDWLDVCASQAKGLGPECVKRAIDEAVGAGAGIGAGGSGGSGGGGDGGDGGNDEGDDRGGHGGGEFRGIGIFDDWEPEVYQRHDDEPQRLVMPEERSLRARMVLTHLFPPRNGWASWGIRYYAGEWFVLGERRGVYVKIAEKRLQRMVRGFFEECVKKKVVKGKVCYVANGMSRDAVLDVLEDVAAAVLVEADTMPTWVHDDFVDDGEGRKRPDFRLRADFDRDACVGPVPAEHVLTFPSGILDGRRWVEGADLKRMPVSPSWFTAAALPWDLPREAAEVARMDDEEANAFVSARCPRWTNQLSAMFDDVEARFVLLQRFFGYTLSAKNGLNKALLIQGLPGTAKGVITHVHGSLVGIKNVAHASLTMLGRPFGAGMLVGAPLISMSEFRIGRTSDEALAYERMLKAISDEVVDVEDKHMRQIRQVRIAGKWIMTPNEDPRIRDESGAFVERLRAIYLTRVFRNTEGEVAGLKYRIVEEELPWIGLWAMIGYRQVERMLAQGRAPKSILPQPEQDAGLLHEMQSTARLVGSFVDEVCVRDPASCVAQRVLYEQHFRPWATEQGGKASEMYISSFTSRLLAATGIPLPDDHRTDDGRSVRVYRGIRPRLPAEVGKVLDKPETKHVLDWTYGPWPYREKVTHYGHQHDLPT